jgi:hypothetical protein
MGISKYEREGKKCEMSEGKGTFVKETQDHLI